MMNAILYIKWSLLYSNTVKLSNVNKTIINLEKSTMDKDAFRAMKIETPQRAIKIR